MKLRFLAAAIFGWAALAVSALPAAADDVDFICIDAPDTNDDGEVVGTFLFCEDAETFRINCNNGTYGAEECEGTDPVAEYVPEGHWLAGIPPAPLPRPRGYPYQYVDSIGMLNGIQDPEIFDPALHGVDLPTPDLPVPEIPGAGRDSHATY